MTNRETKEIKEKWVRFGRLFIKRPIICKGCGKEIKKKFGKYSLAGYKPMFECLDCKKNDSQPQTEWKKEFAKIAPDKLEIGGYICDLRSVIKPIKSFISIQLKEAYQNGKRDGKSVASWHEELKRCVKQTEAKVKEEIVEIVLIYSTRNV